MTNNIELNPLSKLKNRTQKHILIAFQYSADAYSYKFDYNIADVGTPISCPCGSAIVVVNEIKNTVVTISNAVTIWNFFSPVNHRTISYNGEMEIVDRSAFYFNQILTKFTKDLSLSLSHLTFMWVTVFTGVDESDSVKVVTSTPLYFHSTNFVQDASNAFGRSYNLDFVSCHGTHALSPQFSSIIQNTVTNKEANTVNTLPMTYAPSTGLKPLREEDASKLSPRKDRINKTKYMKTIGDFCDRFEYTLSNQAKPHKKQLQEFMGIIRSDYATKVKKLHIEDELPIVYKIKVDDYYKDKQLNNRNLPFEQYEINESINGLSSISFPLGISLQSAIGQVMRMSKEVGNDHTKIPYNTYKIVSTTNRECDGKYHVYTKIKKYIAPYNSDSGVNTGPGNNVVVKPLEFTFQDPEAEDNNLLALTYGATTNTELTPVENVSDDEDTQAVYADREMLTSQRKISDASFFENSYSGQRIARGIFTDNGLQNSEAASKISNYSPTQRTAYTLSIIGNPNLLSDLNRNPQEVIDDTHTNAILYKFSEYEPMYLKLKIFLEGDRRTERPKEVDDSTIYMYENYLHIYKVVNLFDGGEFMQILYCGRTNEKL